jgi:hypothetical protein
LYDEEHHDIYSSPNITKVIESVRLRWAGHTARTAEKINSYTVLRGNLKESDHLEDFSIDGLYN